MEYHTIAIEQNNDKSIPILYLISTTPTAGSSFVYHQAFHATELDFELSLPHLAFPVVSDFSVMVKTRSLILGFSLFEAVQEVLEWSVWLRCRDSHAMQHNAVLTSINLFFSFSVLISRL